MSLTSKSILSDVLHYHTKINNFGTMSYFWKDLTIIDFFYECIERELDQREKRQKESNSLNVNTTQV